MAILARHAREHPGYHFKMDMQLDRPLDGYVEMLRADSLIASTLAQQNVSPLDFAILTVAINSARISQHLVDSLGPEARPANLGSNLFAFWDANRAGIDSLEATLR